MKSVRPTIATPNSVRLSNHHRRQGILGRMVSRNRYVLGGAFLFALGIPEFFHPLLHGHGPWFDYRYMGPLIEPSVWCCLVAILLGHMTLQNTIFLPLVSARSLILPTFVTTFSMVLLVLYSLNFPIARYHVWSSFVLTNIWYYGIAIVRTSRLRPVIGAIGVSSDFFDELPNSIICKRLDRPRLPQGIAAVVIDGHAALDLTWSKFVTKLVLHGIPVYHRSHLEEGLTGKVFFQSHAENNFGALLPSLAYLRIKRLLDVSLAVALLPIIFVLLALACLAIRIESPGTPIFRQERIGYRGQRFMCYKLRTMRSDVAGPAFTQLNDPRITRLGRYLRKWRIDELPQILNILKGEMSWIGPRPEAVALALQYSRQVRFYDYRHAVRPGISGWAAVHQGNVADIEAATEKLAYDFYYIKYFSFWLDVLIAIKTVRTIWTGFGSR